MQQTTNVRLGGVAGRQEGTPGSGPEVQGGGRAAAVRVGTLFYVSPIGNGHVLTVAAVEQSVADELLSSRPVHTLRGEAAAAELVAVAQALVGEDVVASGDRTEEEVATCQATILTPREGEVLRLVAQGCTNRAAAILLGISERGVRYHLENTYRKLEFSGRSEAIVWALQQGLGRAGRAEL